MKQIILSLPIIIALVGKIFSLTTPSFIADFQMYHPIIYGIVGFIAIIFYILVLVLLFDSEDKDAQDIYSVSYIVYIPIVFYLLSNLLSMKVPKFIINFSDSHTIISFILIFIATGIYLFFIVGGASLVIANKNYSLPNIIFALIPVISIVLLYIFDIGMPPFIVNFYNNHKIWFFIVFGIIALSYICVLFNLISYSIAGKIAFVFIIAFFVLTFIYRDNVLFFNNISNNKLVINNSSNEKNNTTVNNNEDIENVIITEENTNNGQNNLTDEDFNDDILSLAKDNLDKILIGLAVLASIVVILFIIRFIDNMRNGVNITYTKDGDIFKLKGKKNNFVITKNGKHSFLVKDGITVAYKPAFKIFEKFKFYNNDNRGK